MAHKSTNIFFFSDKNHIIFKLYILKSHLIISRNSSSLTMAIPNFCAFSNLLGPMLSPAKIKLVFEEMLPTFFPPCFSMNALYSSRE